jgi:hypothetical protein
MQPVNFGLSGPNSPWRMWECADQYIACHALAAFEMQHHAIGGLLEPDGFGIQMKSVGLFAHHRIDERVMQVGPMQGVIRRAVFLDRNVAQLNDGAGPAAIPQTHILACEFGADAQQFRTQTDFLQHAGAVGRDLHAGADFLQLGSLLIDLHIESSLQQRQCCRQSTQTGSSDEDAGLLAHVNPFLVI